jgi:fluoroquinolone transport system ATP-binding protein
MLDVQELRFTYAGAPAPVLRGLTFRIAPGEIFGFLGPSGAGKSTTQNILTGLLRGYQGCVHVLGRDLAAWKSDYYEHIGVAFELPTHFRKLTALENLAYFRALYAHPTLTPQEALDLVDLGAAGRVPVGQFSKGMQTRLGVARALLHAPALLFLDEPTSGLDPVNARRIKELIRARQAAGTTVFLTTHDMALAEDLCDRVAFIVDGGLPLVETPPALKRRYGQAALRVEYTGPAGAAAQTFPLAGLADNAAFLDLLRGGLVQTMHTQEATLDEVFVRVTGRNLA